jgi:hypothetical protein
MGPRAVFEELRPVRLKNCTLKRYGVQNDGGYLMCENLMGQAKAAYSYGIDGRDDWGCDVSQQLRATVHEYDCFNTKRPQCNRGSLTFHEECVGGSAKTSANRIYDTIPRQLKRNGDAGKHLIVKMDIEGDEWASLAATPDEVLDRIDQLAIEFHHKEPAPFAQTVTRLKKQFYVAHFHANNFACMQGMEPFTAWANEVLFVNKRIAVLDSSGGQPDLPNPLDSPNRAGATDCQPVFPPTK